MNDTIIWVVLLGASVAAGMLLVAVLVARRATELPLALLGVGAFGAAAWALVTLPQTNGRPEIAVWAFAFMIAAGAGGYALASSLLYKLAKPGKSRAPIESSTTTEDLAVIVTACIEPATYDPRATAATLEQLAEDGLLDASMAVLPLLFFTQKARYRAIGDKSPAQTELGSVVEHLSYTAPRNAVVSWATCSGSDSIVEAVRRAVAKGCKTIVVAGLFVSEPGHFITARNAVEDLRLDAKGATVRFTRALFDSDRVLAMLASRVLEASSTESMTGAVLIGHGQPEPIARRHPSFDEQELSFLSRLKMTLVERGFPDDSVRVAWADWGSPDVTSSVRHLVALGHRKVLLVPAVYPLDTLATRLDLEVAAHQARVDKDVSVIMLPTWRHDDAVISEVRERVSKALSEPG